MSKPSNLVQGTLDLRIFKIRALIAKWKIREPQRRAIIRVVLRGKD